MIRFTVKTRHLAAGMLLVALIAIIVQGIWLVVLLW